MLQLLLGNIGVSGGGMNALRGHSNIQGLTDLGLMSDLLPGYLKLPPTSEQNYKDYITAKAFKPLRPEPAQLLAELSTSSFVSMMKAWWGDAATAENDWAYNYLPKLDKLYDMLQFFELMHQGKMTGFICQGFNPLAAAPNKAKIEREPGETEVPGRSWIRSPPRPPSSGSNFGEHNDVDPSKIQTEVFRLPTNCFAEENGSLTNSSRWLQWHWKGAEPPGDARSDLQIMGELFTRMRAAVPRPKAARFPIPSSTSPGRTLSPTARSPEELAKEYSGKALKDLADPKDPTKITRKAGEQFAGFAELRNDGSTSSGCWIFCGAWGPTGNLMARRDNSDPTGIGQTLNWAFAWPANRRVLYNRASCDPNGKPFNPSRKLDAWNGTAWGGADVPDFKADEDPTHGMGPFIMNAEGVARFFARDGHGRGSLPGALRAVGNAAGDNPLQPEQATSSNNPAARVFD